MVNIQKQWWAALLLAIIAFAVPTVVRAADGDFDSPKIAFTWYQKGQGCMHLKLMTTNASPYRTLHSATYGVIGKDGKKTPVFQIAEYNSENSGYVISHFTNYLSGSLLYLTNDTYWKPLCFIYEGALQEHHHTRNGKDNGYAELDWYYPTSFAGQSLTFYVDATLWKSGGSTSTYQKEIGTMDFDEITLDTYDAFPATDASESGMLKIPFVSNREMKSVQVSYTDEFGRRKTLDRVTLDKGMYSGFITIPATDVHKDLTLTANVISGKPNEGDVPNADWPKELTGDVSITLDKVPMIHAPRLLTANVQTDSVCNASVLLKWQIANKDFDDALDGEMFLVQRSLTGRLEDFLDIGSVEFDNNETDYEYEDKTFISSLTPELIDAKAGIPLVRYRVVRASSRELWAMDHNPAVAYVMPRLKPLVLVKPKNVRADWSDEENRKVKLTWAYEKSEIEVQTPDYKGGDCHYVWDDRAEMRVVTLMYNRDGGLVDSLTHVLTPAERTSRTVELTLNRSCVSYDLRIVVDGKTSPIGKATGDLLVLINSQDDWNRFAKRVNNGETTLNAMLYGFRPRITNLDQTVGVTSSPYRGIFLGNNEELTTNLNVTDYTVGPFRALGHGAVIAFGIFNTTISTSRQFASGVAGRIYDGGTAFIENCIVNLDFRATIGGDGSHGSLVALLDKNESLFASNVLVNGSWSGSNTTNCGGLVGFARGTAFVMADRVYFGVEPTSTSSSFTLVRTPVAGETNVVIRDCCYKTAFGKEQGTQANDIPSTWGWALNVPVQGYIFCPDILSWREASATLPADKFYYENHGQVLKNSLRVQPLRSSALLTWETDGGAVDYFEVYRVKTDDPNPENWERIANQLIDTQYEDQNTSPVHTYRYFVQSANDCEGTSYVPTKVVEGGCFQTCTVEGYVRFPDGTGIPNRPVYITEDRENSKTYKAMTDANGHFIMNGLPYWDGGVGVYRVSPDVPGYEGMKSISFGTEPGQNYISGVEFEVTSSVKFSGYVQYNGTSIPVQGVHFLVDGTEVHTAAGPVESDHEGKFAFRMLPGEHRIQAVKDGHDFYDGGWYYADEQNKTDPRYDFQTDKAGIYFYDDTRVKLIGRVAGGNVQAGLPLDNSLGRNNLGDNLEMVFTLEGDNVSRLVWDILDRTKKETDSVYVHTSHDKKFKYQTQVHTTEHRMVVKPDVHTGEFVVYLPPVKWKIQQITAKGYPTLFQEGTINDVIDLTDSLTWHSNVLKGEWRNANGDPVREVTEVYQAKYSRIYRSPVILDRQQLGYEKFNYFGDRYYTAKNLQGEKVKVPLCYPAGEKSTEAKYTFGYPVFNIERQYPVKISAVEKYYYNNNTKSDTVDIIKLSGGVVTIRNSMVSATHRDTVHLDKQGERIYMLEAKQTPYSLTGKDALQLVTMTLELDGTHFEADPLRAYVLNTYVMPGAKDILSIDKPELVDILRDPPGGGSSAKLSRGSTLKYGYTFDWSAAGGLTLGFAFGSKVNQYVGVVALAAESGLINNGESDFAFDVDLMFSASGKQAYSYTMTANSDISTSSANTMVGANADVYIGTETSYVVTPALAIRAIDSTMWKQLEGARKAGALVEIATGRDESGHTFHLVRDEVLSIGPKIKSTFMHSQAYILGQLIPNLEQECKSLLFTGSKDDAQAVADSTGKVVYWSLRDYDDDNYGVVNTTKSVEKGDDSWTYFYNTTIDKAQEGINYMIILPKGYQGGREDRISEFSQSALWWAEMIARNEKEKLEATTLVKNFDIDGGAPLSYSEDFSADISYTSQVHYFWESTPSNVIASSIKWLAKTIGGAMGYGGKGVGPADNNKNDVKEGNINWAGYSFKFSITPQASYNFNTPYSTDKKFNRKESFNISMDKKSHLVVDVYAVKNQFNDGSEGTFEVFSNKNFYKAFDKVDDEVTHDIASYPDVGKVSKSDLTYARGFVYRTRGGATARPWEGERVTNFYRSGTVLDERTKKIENPTIKLDKQSVSGVPFDEPARFKVYLTNESEQPEAIGGMLQFFYLYLDDTSNPKGAKLMMDGMPLSRGGTMVMVVPGSVTEKTIEVWPGEDFDYENLRIGIVSLEDIDMWKEIEFSVHFLQGAGPVEIAMPGDKWIMNTDASYDKERGWHMPVIISGFNKNQKNFDHIEFQYKESTRGDDYWTNLCAFYADSTYYLPASGTKAMIPENGNIITDFYGEGVVMEKAYDLRAVLFCRNGNSYLTSTSKVLSGVKDTRRPQLFGTPEPKDGILGAGDNIVFNFSEPIEHNYLRETTNFEVKGETNENSIQEEPALLFSGSGYAQSEARRNFADKDVTVEVMVKPDTIGVDMPVFSHGMDGKQLQLWITKRNQLKAVVDDRTLTLEQPLDFSGYVQVAMALDNKNKRLTLYADTLSGSLDSVVYSGYGPIIFGSTNQSDVSKRKYFKGRMLQGRIWNRVMDKTLLNFYGDQQLTGYEMGLTDYYPMNEGHGKFATDEAQGAHLTLNGASWSQPRGMSLRLDWDEKRTVKGMKLKPAFFSRTSEQDYTLMFWFRTDVKGRGAMLSNGTGRKTDMSPENKFFIGFEADTLKYRSNGMEFKLGNTYSDDAWHHYAMTVNRAHQVASIYVDNVLKAQFSTENLGGMSGDDFYLGNMVWHEQGLNNDVLHQYNAMTGHLDGICLFEQALPVSLIKRYSTKAIGGSEKGLITYLNFDRQERQKNGDIVLRPYVLSQKIHYDLDGKETDKRDTVFVDTNDFVRQHIDQNIGAPVQAYEELRNLNFSYVGRDNQLLVNLDELDSRINKRSVYVTVYDIPDLNGNYMASPATVAIYVDRNPLRWERKTYKTTLWYDGYDYEFSVNINNNSGAPHTYTVENLPKWLSVDKTSDMIEPKSEQWLTFTINKDINVGSYDHIIYLTDENELSEPLMLNITIEGKAPEWYVDPDMKQYSMSVVGRVQIGDDVVTDSRDLVAAFDSKGRCMGVANVSYSSLSGEALVYMTLYTEDSSNTDSLKFKLWHYATGKVMVVQPSEVIKFSLNGTVGTIKKPVVLQAGNLFIQELALQKGWNWISFNVYNSDFNDGVNEMLKKYKWQEGDILVDETNSLMLVYKNTEWLRNLTPGSSTATPDSAPANYSLSVANSYRLKVANDVTVELVGTALRQPYQRVITVKKGWNHIGYTPVVNLTVQTALADYFDQAADGDVVKSKTEFAMFSKGANGKAEWKGNLKYMKPGEGYMLYRQRENTTTFKYPFYETNSTIVESASSRETDAASRSYANTMSLAAVTDGVELQEGDRLLALSEAEVRGEALVGDSVVYMSISGDSKAPLSFAIEREGEIIAMTGDVLTYGADNVSGTPDEPTRISFAPVSLPEQEGWYTLQGIRLQSRPTKGGVYIYNGHKRIIR